MNKKWVIIIMMSGGIYYNLHILYRQDSFIQQTYRLLSLWINSHFHSIPKLMWQTLKSVSGLGKNNSQNSQSVDSLSLNGELVNWSNINCQQFQQIFSPQ